MMKIKLNKKLKILNNDKVYKYLSFIIIIIIIIFQFLLFKLGIPVAA